MATTGFSNFPNGFPNIGVTIRNVPITVSNPGQVFWLSNSTVAGPGCVGGSDNNPGTFTKPFSTLSGALNACVAGRGDVIYIKPGHAESVASAGAIVLSKAGVAIVGLGSGSLRPTFTFTTATTSSITVTANNVSIQNCLFISGFAAMAQCFAVANAQVATDLTIDSCEFRDSSTTLNFVKVLTIGTTANICDGLWFTRNRIIGIMGTPTAGTTAIGLSSDIARANISGNFVSHQVLLANTACLLEAGANNVQNSLLQGNITDRPNTASNGELVSTSGTSWLGTMICDNYCGTLSANGLVAPVSTKAQFINNYCMITGAQDKSALVNPAAV